MRPQQSAQSLAPARWIAEQVDQPALFCAVVAPQGGLDPDLASEDDRGNERLAGIRFRDPKLEREVGRCRERDGNCVDYLESKINHGQALWLAGCASTF